MLLEINVLNSEDVLRNVLIMVVIHVVASVKNVDPVYIQHHHHPHHHDQALSLFTEVQLYSTDAIE